MHDARAGGNEAVVKESGRLPQPGAGGHDNVGVADGVNSLRSAQPAQMPQVVGMVVRHGVGPPVGGNDGCAGQFGQPGDLRIGQAPFHAAAGQDYGPLRRQNLPRRRLNLPAVAAGFALPGAIGGGGQRVQRNLRPRQQIPGDVH